MESNVSLIGESRDGVICTINMTGAIGFSFYNDNNAGIYRMTIQGGWGEPKYKWNYSINANNELPNNDNVSVKLKQSNNLHSAPCFSVFNN